MVDSKIIVQKAIMPVTWLCGLMPLFWLFWAFFWGNLTANPIEFINRYLGGMAIKFLCLSLAVTPIRIVTNWTEIARLRKLLGLFSFTYACLHLLFYITIEQFFNWAGILEDIIKRKYITVGLLAFIILFTLAATSTKNMVKRLGGRNWKRLHQGVYLAGLLGCGHFLMMSKGAQYEPLYYLGFILLTYLIRVVFFLKRFI